MLLYLCLARSLYSSLTLRESEKYATAESVFKNKTKCQEIWERCSVVRRWGCGPRPCSPLAWSWPILPSSSVNLWNSMRKVTGSSGPVGQHPCLSVQFWYTTRFWDTRYIGHINGIRYSFASFHSFESIKREKQTGGFFKSHIIVCMLIFWCFKGLALFHLQPSARWIQAHYGQHSDDDFGNKVMNKLINKILLKTFFRSEYPWRCCTPGGGCAWWTLLVCWPPPSCSPSTPL